MEETTSQAISTAASRVLIPAVRLICWTTLVLSLLAQLTIGNGFVPLASGIGFVGLLVLPAWEKVGLFTLMLAVAWLGA